MRASDSDYLQTLFKIHHSFALLGSLGLDPHSLCRSSENSGGAGAEPLHSSGTHLDTPRGTSDGGVPLQVLEMLKAEFSPSWVQSRAEHERVKRSVCRSLELCASSPPPGKRSPRFKPDRMAKRISLCQSSHLTLKGKDGEMMILPIACDSPFCPSCSRHKTIEQVKRIEKQLGPRLRQYDLRWITLTMRNVERGRLSEALDDLLLAWRRLRQAESGRQWENRVRGYLWNLEITIGKGRTWHPHIHVLYDGDFWPGEDLDRTWKTRLASRGHVGKAVIGRAYYKRNGEKVYLTGDETASADEIFDCLVEVSKYTIAPIESRGTPAAMIYELAGALFGRRLRGSAGTMELRKGMKTPAWWTSMGSLRDVLNPESKHFLGGEAEWRRLLAAATAHRGLWNDLIRIYHPFYAAALSGVAYKSK